MGFFDKLKRVVAAVNPVALVANAGVVRGAEAASNFFGLGGDKGPGEAYYQQQIANEQLAQATREREQSLALSARSPSEIELRNNLNQIRLQTLGQGQRELDFLQRGLDINEPGASEAGRGLYSSVMLRQRQAQRGLLESSLRQRFGAGYATTSAGQSALQQFDAQTSDLATSLIPQVLQSQSAAVLQQAEYENLLTGRQISAANRTSLVPFAGSQYVGGLIQARQEAINQQSQSQMLGTILGAGAGMALTKGNPMGAFYGAQIGGSMMGGGGNVQFENLTQPKTLGDYSFIKN